MSLQYIIDGYNLINHKLFTATSKKINPHTNCYIKNINKTIGEGVKDSRIALLELIRIKRLCGSAKNKIAVVFDGYPDTEVSREFDTAIDVIFTRKQTADERIKKFVENSGSPKNIVVVTDDKEIKFFVKSLGAKVLNVEEFINPGSRHRGKVNSRKYSLCPPREESLKPELTYTQMHQINQELKKIWLK